MKELHRLKKNGQKLKTLEDIVKVLKVHGKELTEKYGIKSIRVFGSYAEGKQREMSDLDLIGVFKKHLLLLNWCGLKKSLKKCSV